MEQSLWETMEETSKILHWFGRYEESQATAYLARLLKAKELRSLEDLARYVEAEEAKC